jgi:hypothetical protein
VRSVIVPALIAITQKCIQYFQNSSNIAQFAKFFIGMGCAEMYANVSFQCLHPQNAVRYGKRTTLCE